MKPEDKMSRKFGVLNCPPNEDSGASATPLCEKREACNYTDLSKHFLQQSKDFTKQFAHIYAVRLNSQRDSLIKRSLNKWGKLGCLQPICRLPRPN